MKAAVYTGIFVAGAIASHILAAHTPTRFTIDVLQPLAVATNWRAFGALTFGVLAATLAFAYLPYQSMLRKPPALAVTLLAAAASLVATLFFTPLFSSDVYAYAAYGEMARLGLDPYVHHALPANDPVFTAAQWQWNPMVPVCVYGELFVAIARGIATLFATAPVVVLLDALRVLAMLAFIGTIALAYTIPRDDARKRFVAVFIGCNPVLIWSVAEGHNDALMALAVVAAAAVLARAPLTAIALAACGALVKMPAMLATAVAGYRAYVAGERRALVATIVAAAVVIAGYGRWLHGIRSDLLPHGHFAPQVSVQSIAWSVVTAIDPHAETLAIAAAALLAFFAAGALAYASFRTRGIDRYTLLALAAWLCIPNPYPWYALWILPLAAFAGNARLRTTVMCVTAVALLRYLPDAAGTPPLWIDTLLGIAAAAAFLPLIAGDKRAAAPH